MDFALARRNMVESQLRTNKITSQNLLDALHGIPRERFVPTSQRSQAYTDEHVSLTSERWLLPAMPIARLIQESCPQQEDNALVVGDGIGYSAALLGKLCKSVFVVESLSDLAREMSAALTELALDNVVTIEGPLQEGYRAEGPYDIILIAGGVESVPDALLDQLAEGGRLMTVVSAPGSVGKATLYGKRNGVVSSRVLFDAIVKLLPDFEKEPTFSL